LLVFPLQVSLCITKKAHEFRNGKKNEKSLAENGENAYIDAFLRKKTVEKPIFFGKMC